MSGHPPFLLDNRVDAGGLPVQEISDSELRSSISYRYGKIAQPGVRHTFLTGDSNHLRLATQEELTGRDWPGTRLDGTRTRPKEEVVSGYTRFREGDVLVPKITPTFEADRSTITRRPSLAMTLPAVEALVTLDRRTIPWGNGGLWWPVKLHGLPGDNAGLGELVTLHVMLPPGADRGPPIDRRRLSELRVHSGGAYRALDCHARARVAARTYTQGSRRNVAPVRRSVGRHEARSSRSRCRAIALAR